MTLNAHALGALVWLAFGVFIVWAGRDLGIGTVTDPGPGFLFAVAGALIVLFAVSIGIGALGPSAVTLGSLWADTRWRTVLVVVVALIAYASLIGTIGFLMATLPLMLALLRFVDPVRWSIALPLAFGATFGVWWLVERLLGVQLPKAVFEFG
jgi:putative tricarboxylic transport membrane protein